MTSPQSRTLGLARQHGGGAILTDGVDRFRISDWSLADGRVYGHTVSDGHWGGYRELQPEGLWLDPDQSREPAVWKIQHKEDPLQFWIEGFGWSLHLEATEYADKRSVTLPALGKWVEAIRT